MNNAQFWLEKWQANEIGFHQTTVHPLLEKFWSNLHLKTNSRVLVPLCGKSMDMLWLQRQGHHVIGIELSELAIEAFIQENELTLKRKQRANYTLYYNDDFSLYCADLFALTTHIIGMIDAFYDRAALIALNSEQRPRYAKKITELASEKSKGLLISLEYEQSLMTGPPFSVAHQEIVSLYHETWKVAESYRREATLDKNESLYQKGIRSVTHTVHHLLR